jgi:hypothetical protein
MLLVVLLVAFFVRGGTNRAIGTPRGSDSASLADAEKAMGLARAGTLLRYALSMRSNDEQAEDAASSLPALQGSIELEAELTSQVSQCSGGQRYVTFSFPTVSTLRWQFAGTSVLGDAQRPESFLEDQTAWVAFDECRGSSAAPGEGNGSRGDAQSELWTCGLPREFLFPPDTDNRVVMLVMEIVSQLQLTTGGNGGSQWRTEERNNSGVREFTYRRLEDGDDGLLRIEKVPHGYLELWGRSAEQLSQKAEGSLLIARNHAGAVQSISGQLDLEGTWKDGSLPPWHSDVTVRLELVHGSERANAQCDSNLLARFRRVTLGENTLEAQAKQQALDSRIGGITAEQMRRDLLAYGNAGRMPDHDRWMWRVMGLLLRDPELARQLGELFKEDDLNDRGRRLILALLRGAGHEIAQEVLVDALSSPAARNSEVYPLMLQEVTLLTDPRAAVGTFISEEYSRQSALKEEQDTEPHGYYSASYALGAVAGKLKETAPDLARRLNGRLRSDLQETTCGQSRTHLLAALGNAGQVENVELLSSHARADYGPLQRIAAIDALRKTQTEASEELLIGTLTDSSKNVANAALASLEQYELTAEQLQEIADQLSASPREGEGLGQWLGWLERILEEERRAGQGSTVADKADVARLALAQLVHHGTGSPRMAHRARLLLAEYGAGLLH